MTARRGAMLRFDSEDDLFAHRARQARRDARNNASRARPVIAERDVQASVLAFLRKHPRVAWAQRFNSGVTKISNADGTERFIRFAFKGCSDILGMLRGGRFLAVECKRAGERPTDEQRAFIDAVNGGGGLAFVACSIDDVARALQ